MARNDQATIDATQAKIVKLLKSAEPNKIAFRFPGGSGEVVIRKGAYQAVADRFESGLIQTVILDDAIKAKNPEAGAGFVPGGFRSQFVVDPDIDTATLESIIVHEATHAALYYGVRRPMRFNNEAASYVAEEIYVRLREKATGVPDDTYTSLSAASGAVAKDLIARHAENKDGSPLPVDGKLWTKLVSSVKATPLYSKKTDSDEDVRDRTFEPSEVTGTWRVMCGANPPDTFTWDWIYEFGGDRSVTWRDRADSSKHGKGKWSINAKKDRLVMRWQSGVVETLDAPPQSVQNPSMGGKTTVGGKTQKMLFTRSMG